MSELSKGRFPQFPESRSIEISDKKAFDDAFAGMQPKISEFTFTNLFLWGRARGYKVSGLDGHIIVSHRKGGKKAFFAPIGKEPARVISGMLGKDSGAIFTSVPGDIASKVRGDGVAAEEDRDSFDYVYKREDLARLGGAKYYPKRSFARKAMEYDPVVLEKDQVDVGGCRKLQDEWCRERMCESDQALREEAEALYALFLNKKELWVTCIAVRIDGKVAAFSAGEMLNDETFVVHFEKADTRYKGIYQLINQEFAKRVPEGFRFINREQDLGIEGLRKAKKSYHPAFMVKKFTIRRNA